MAASIPSSSLPPEEAIALVMSELRAKNTREVKRNGVTMINPYAFAIAEDAAENQQLGISLLDQVYAAPIADQATLVAKLGHENDPALPYMVWDTYITGHVDLFNALRTFGLRTVGPDGWEDSANKYTSARMKEVFDSAEAKIEAIEKWLVEFPYEASDLLFEAAVNGDDQVLAHMLEAGHEIHPKADSSIMPLHAACYNGHFGAVQQLLGAGIDVNHLDEFGSTPLMRASVGGKAELVEWLLQRGADLHVRETRQRGSTALELGVGNASVARLLVDNGAEWTPVAFAAAANFGNEETFAMMAEMGDFPPYDPNAATPSETILTDRQREAVLLSIRHCASRQAASGNILRWLLGLIASSHDGDAYELDESDEQLWNAVRAAISGAVSKDDVDTARLLISNLPPTAIPAAPESTTEAEPQGLVNWLLDAMHQNIMTVASFFISSEPSNRFPIVPAQASEPQPKTLGDWLLDAAHFNASSVARLLISEFKTDSNIVAGPRSETPLAVAAQAGHAEMLKLLVSSFGADTHKASGPHANGPTALWHAVWSQQELAARTLLELGGPVEAIHAEVKGDAKRLWLTAEKQTVYRSPAMLVAWMNPAWYGEENEDRFLCLEFPDGFAGQIMTRKGNEELEFGDARPLVVSE